MSKLVKDVFPRLLEHIHVNKLDNPYHSTYKAGHSTGQLFCQGNGVHFSLSRDKPTALVLLDPSAASDIIDHSTLFRCFQTWFGLGSSIFKWFIYYLTEHYQSIKIGSTLSDLCKLLCVALCCSHCTLLPSVSLLVSTRNKVFLYR